MQLFRQRGRKLFACVFLCCVASVVCRAAGPPPVITIEPADASVPLGGVATFAVVATSATTLSYQWYFNGAVISGATLSSYGRSNVSLTDAGLYYVAVVNAGGTVNSRQATLRVVNAPPVASPDTYTTPENTPLSIVAPGVLSNDTDANGDALTALLLGGALYGTVFLNPDGGFTYVPQTGFVGPDGFRYCVADFHAVEQNTSGGKKVSIKQGQKGAQSFRHGISGGPAYSVSRVLLHLSRGLQPPNAPLTFSVGTGVNSGALAGSTVSIDPSVITNTSAGTTFQPYDVFLYPPVGPLLAGTTYYLNLECEASNGKDIKMEYALGSAYSAGTFYLAGSDDSGDIRFRVAEGAYSSPATVTVTVTPVNHPPVAVNDTTNTLKDASVLVNVLANDSDPEGDPLTITGASTTNGTVAITRQGILFTPAAGFYGTAVFTYTVSDGTNYASAQATVEVIDTGFHFTESLFARYQGDPAYDDSVQAIATDAQGAIYLTGYAHEPSSLTYDYVTLKYDPLGGLLWRAVYDRAWKIDRARALAVDPAGNVYVTGGAEKSNGKADFFTIKYDPVGTQLWTASYDGSAREDEAVAVAVDNAGNVYVTGQSLGVDANYDYATVKYGPDGTQLWVARYNGPGNGDDFPTSLALDSDGNIFVTGRSTGAGTGFDYATVKYSSDGAQRWVARYNGPGNGDDMAVKVKVDRAGNACVAGSSVGVAGYFDYAVMKYSPDGTQLWLARFNGAADLNDQAADLAIDSDGAVLVTGTSQASATGFACATLKYSARGQLLWAALEGAAGDNQGIALALDPSGDVCVSGTASSSSTGYDIAMFKYLNGDGTRMWSATWNSVTNCEDKAVGVSVDPNYNVYVAGQGFNPKQFVLLKYQPNFLPPVASTLPATEVSLASAVLNGQFIPAGAASGFYFEYGESTAYGMFSTTNDIPDGATPVPLAAHISDLTPGTLYHCRVVVVNIAGTSKGQDTTFTTAPFVFTGVLLGPGRVQLSLSAMPGCSFTVLASTNPAAPLTGWTTLGSMTESSPGLYEYLDSKLAGDAQRYYRLRSP